MPYVLLFAAFIPSQDLPGGPGGHSPPLPPRGHLLIVGGGPTTADICKKALEVAGGADAQVVIVPQASARSTAGERSALLWQSAGARNVSILDLNNVKAAVELLGKARLIWMPGGDQNRLMQTLAKTGIPEAIHKRFVEGAVVGGTSAGAAVMSQHMIAGGPGGDPNKPVMPAMGQGLGLIPEAIIDQHFSRRNRYGRLVGAVLGNPNLIGVGIDECTAILVSGRSFEVFGQSNVFVYDARPAADKAVAKSEKPAPQTIQPRVLKAGMKYSLDMLGTPVTSNLAEKTTRAD